MFPRGRGAGEDDAAGAILRVYPGLGDFLLESIDELSACDGAVSCGCAADLQFVSSWL